jgi:hypothetical protein
MGHAGPIARSYGLVEGIGNQIPGLTTNFRSMLYARLASTIAVGLMRVPEGLRAEFAGSRERSLLEGGFRVKLSRIGIDPRQHHCPISREGASNNE